MIKFSKLQGAGNDFVIINLLDGKTDDLSELAKMMCNRHFGIGADGLIAVNNSHLADVAMIYYNSDGTIGEMCGNGIRCFSKYVYEKSIVRKEKILVETMAGIKEIFLSEKDGKVNSIRVDMGTWDFNVNHIPVNTKLDKFIQETMEIDQKNIQISCVLLGVPHAVIFVDEINTQKTAALGPIIENMNIFPKRINVNFVQLVDRSHIKVDTWERGAGKTLACGTGACASVVVANKLGYIDDFAYVSVAGGELRIDIQENQKVIMEGKAEFICDGEFYI